MFVDPVSQSLSLHGWLSICENKNMDTTQMIGIGAGILTASSTLPQLVKIIKEKKAADVSILMIIVLIVGLSLWVVYGLMQNDWPLIVTNSFSVLVNILLLIYRLRYGNK